MAYRDVTDPTQNDDKTTPASGDRFLIIDSSTSPDSLKEITYANFTTWMGTLYNGSLPQGGMRNGKLSVTVASNNLTVALKTLAGADPSASDPIYVRIGDTVRTLTAALSVTKNAGTNWCNSGSAELATKEIDYFVYLGYNATDGVVIGFSRISHARRYDDFSTTSTNEKYCAISTITTAAAGDYYENIGRFAATLSAGAGYTWSVPTFTAANLVNQPTRTTRLLSYAPTIVGYSANPTNALYRYRVVDEGFIRVYHSEGANGTSNATSHTYTAPFACETLSNTRYDGVATITVDNGTLGANGYGVMSSGSNVISMFKSAAVDWTASGACRVSTFFVEYKI